jgi:hypothetical protein
MAKIITVSLKKGTTTLASLGTIDVADGETVQWVIKSGSAITKITAIKDTSAAPSNDIFSGGTEPTAENKWTGVVGTSAKGNESYCIHYEIDSKKYQDDPKLKINNAPN